MPDAESILRVSFRAESRALICLSTILLFAVVCSIKIKRTDRRTHSRPINAQKDRLIFLLLTGLTLTPAGLNGTAPAVAAKIYMKKRHFFYLSVGNPAFY